MITKIDRYIIKKFLGAFILALGLFTVIIIVFDLSEKIDDFIEHNLGMKSIIFDFYIYMIPGLLNLFSPVFVFISVIFFTSKLAQRSEIVAILSSGVSYLRFLRPYIITSLLLGFFSFVLTGWIVPKADKNRVKFENIITRSKAGEQLRNFKTQLKPGVVLGFNNYDNRDSIGYGVTLESYDSSGLVSKLTARKMDWNRELDKWQLHDYWIRIFKEEYEEIQKGSFIDTLIPFEPGDYFRRNDDVQSFNMQELEHFIDLEKMRGTGNFFFYYTEKHRRFATPIAIMILTLIGVTVSSRKSRGGVGLSLGIGLLLSFTFLIVQQVFTAFGSSGSIYAPLAVWIPNVIFAFVAFLGYKLAQK